MQQNNMPVDDAPDDEDTRETYNFAPGYHGLVYRADVPHYGAGGAPQDRGQGDNESPDLDGHESAPTEELKETRYKLQAMKWGLVPFWTKRNPDYGTVMKTINARDDSLAAKGGMWNTMKQRKRCIVVAQGFYEWLKKNGGKEKIPHFTKRKDGQLMCFAGLWDCVQYEDSDEKHYTYTIITTDSNKQLSFLHDRMPVIIENGSVDVRTWLDPKRSQWSKELQSLLIPFQGELECYPVSKDVGKVGNNSPAFIVPVASTENKANIANFFSNAKKANAFQKKAKTKQNTAESDSRSTIDHSGSEDNVPLPAPGSTPPSRGTKRELGLDAGAEDQPSQKIMKLESDHPQAHPLVKVSPDKAGRKARNATSNDTRFSPAKPGGGSHRITDFFGSPPAG